MNKILVRIGLFISACFLSFAFAVVYVQADTEPIVTYDGSSHTFTVEGAPPYENNNKADLFQNLKGIMPGDQIVQKIKIRIKNLDSKLVAITLKARKGNQDYQTLIGADHVSFAVQQGNTKYTGSLEKGMTLGKFTNNQQKTITVTLHVGQEATGEEMENLVAGTNWIFEAKEIDPKSDSGKEGDSHSQKTSGAKTGDAGNISAYVIALAAAFIILMLCIRCKRQS